MTRTTMTRRTASNNLKKRDDRPIDGCCTTVIVTTREGRVIYVKAIEGLGEKKLYSGSRNEHQRIQ